MIPELEWPFSPDSVRLTVEAFAPRMDKHFSATTAEILSSVIRAHSVVWI